MNLCGALLPLLFTVMNCSPIISSNFPGKSACEQQDVVLNCSVIDTGRLTWIIGSRDNTILFKVADISTLTTQTDSTGQFTAFVTHYSIHEEISILGNLSSTLHTQINSSITDYPLVISCDDGIHSRVSYNITLAGPPSPPQNVTVEVVYGVSEYTLIVQWNSSRDDGGVDIDIFTLPVYYGDQEVFVGITISLSQILHLNYSRNYSLTLTASNCAGTSSSVALISIEAGCIAPLAAVDVIIEVYSSTEEEAVIQFHCQNGYHPTEWVTSQCINSSWSPDPLMMLCDNPMDFKTRTPSQPYPTPSDIPDQNYRVCMECVKSSTAIIIVVVCSVVFLGVGVLLGVMGLYLIQRVRRKFSGSSFSSPSPLPPPVNYEEVGVAREVKSPQDIPLTTNEAYSSIRL